MSKGRGTSFLKVMLECDDDWYDVLYHILLDYLSNQLGLSLIDDRFSHLHPVINVRVHLGSQRGQFDLFAAEDVQSVLKEAVGVFI